MGGRGGVVTRDSMASRFQSNFPVTTSPHHNNPPSPDPDAMPPWQRRPDIPSDEDHDHEALNTMPLFSPSQSLYQRRGAVLATVTMGDERQNNRGRRELYTNLGLFQPALQTPFSCTHMQTTDGPYLPFQHPPESRVNATNGIVPDEDLDISRSWHAVLCLVYYGWRERRAGSWRTFNEEGKKIGRTGGALCTCKFVESGDAIDIQ